MLAFHIFSECRQPLRRSVLNVSNGTNMVIQFLHFNSGPYRGWDLRAGGSTGGTGLRLLSGPIQVSGASVTGPRPLVLLPHVQVSPILLLQKLRLHAVSLLVCLFCGILSSGACQSLVSHSLINKEMCCKMRMILGVEIDASHIGEERFEWYNAVLHCETFHLVTVFYLFEVTVCMKH